MPAALESQTRLKGVIAAVATPFDASGEPDLPRYVDWCEWLLSHGCDALNLCGTTGEATSMPVAQRMALMSAAAERLPRERLMVGTGAAAVADAVELTRHAARLGFGAALVLPPFFYPDPSPQGLADYFERLADATAAQALPIYLYHIPANTKVPFTLEVIGLLRHRLGGRLRGLKDSAGDMGYARSVAAIAPDFDVFPSNEAVLLEARGGAFAGCISASANVNSELCARAWREGDDRALEVAKAMRAAVSRHNLVASVKAVVADLRSDPVYEKPLPPLVALSQEARQWVVQEVRRLRGSSL
ncbi:dihydrodipicolinate synthase family protein [Ramlibacter sp. AW1]|uniref:Dihydrodipicolinate synthase family protein n=1 Tax=Ramlibacter aurantiacus TaxID=2801330 RepID=A0A936ZR40_9BURK|nr:dihydrodipicolinate synthase family protein [Ramlibacter aurantiacus]MBL0421938.1 dihydrodipicolinate synthase family protein [Ramlibacter aurantiacus]